MDVLWAGRCAIHICKRQKVHGQGIWQEVPRLQTRSLLRLPRKPRQKKNLFTMIDKLINEIISNWATIPFAEMDQWLNSLKEKYERDLGGD